LGSTSGQWSGTAGTPAGVYSFLVQASNGAAVAVRQVTLNVTPISITTSSTLPFGNVNSLYSQTLTATGGTGQIAWTVSAGSYLPPGPTLTAGVLTSTPASSA